MTAGVRLLSLAVVALAAACSAQPTATPTLTPTPTPPPRIETSPAAQALRARADAFAAARNEARFEEMYESFTLPAFREECDVYGWIGGLVGDARVLRAFAGIDGDDEPLKWTVAMVEVVGNIGSVVERVATLDGGRSVGIDTRPWVLVDGEWWIGEPPQRACNMITL